MKRVISKSLAFLLAAGMMISCLSIMPSAANRKAYAADDQQGVSYDDDVSNQDLYEKMTGQEEKPEGYNDSLKSVDPYGYGVDVPFYLNKQSELVVYATNDFRDDPGSERTIRSYNLLSGSNVGNILKGAGLSESYQIPRGGTPAVITKPLNYVKTIAFDPTGSGRKDHLAVLGVYNEDNGNDDGSKSLWLYVYNKDGSLVSQFEKLGNMNWLGDHGNDNDAAWYYNALNFLSITAGDYNKDKKDTLVIWGCFDGTGYGLMEVTVKVIPPSKTSTGSITLSKTSISRTLLHDEYVMSGTTLATNHQWVDNKLCCALDTGDVNGDKIDDLVVLSFVDIMTASDNGRTQRTQMYAPYLAVSYGKDLLGSVIDQKSAITRVMKQTGSSNNIAQYLTCMAADVSTGDIDADGKDEIVVAGLKNEVRGNLDTLVDSAYNDDRIQQSKTTIGAYQCSENEMTELCLEMHNANKWTSEGYYPKVNGEDESYDQCLQQYAVQCFAVNGKGNPYMVFVNGDIYKFDGDKMTCVHESEYFEDSDKKFLGTGTELTNTFFTSVAAGNFDGNNLGHEQVVYAFGVKTSKHEQYHLAVGIAGGDFSKDTTEAGLAKYYYSTSENTYESSANRDVYFPSKDSERYVSANLKHNYGLNYYICAMDNDEDGILVRYHDKGYVYTDPEILGVLQAAPRYEELNEYGANNNGTTYSFMKSVSYEDSTSNSVSFGAGAVAGAETAVAEFEIKAGYAMDWSEEFTEGFTKSKEYSFTADKDDAVVMFRTPVTLYYYQRKAPNGEWIESKPGDEEDNSIVLAFPGTPAYSIIGVDKYNEFAAYYNKTNEARMKALGKNVSDAPKLALLTDTDTKKLYLNTGQDPAKYINRKAIPSGVQILQDKAIAFAASTGSTGFNYGTEHSSSTSNSMSHGFTFEMTVQFDVGIKGLASSSVGGYVSLEYMHGNSHTTTDAEGKGISCSISNANLKDMKAAGYSDAACASYGYNYQMAQWDSPIESSVPYEDPFTGKVTIQKQNVPIFGYVLSDVKKPVYAGIKAPSALVLNEGYGATTSGTFGIAGDPVPTVKKVSGNDKITYNAITRKLEIAPGLKIGTYPVKLRAENGIPGKSYTCTFNVKVQAPDYSESGLISSVETLLKGLSDPKDLLLSDEVYVQQARASYEALTAAQKAKISATLVAKLEKAEEQIRKFREAVTAAEELIAEELPGLNASIKAMIDTISAGSIPSESEIQELVIGFTEIEGAYNDLNNDQKALVSAKSTDDLAKAKGALAGLLDEYDGVILETGENNKKKQADQEAADKVIALIGKIGDLSAIDPAAVNEEQFELLYQTAVKTVEVAKKAYDNLTVQQKVLVTNAKQLIASEKTLGSILTQRCKEVAAQQDSKEYKDAVAKLKKVPKTVVLKSDGAILAARYAYDILSPEMKKKVDSGLLKTLTAAEKKLASFKKAISKNGTTITKVTGAKKSLKVSWKKQTKKVSKTAITGYELQVATNKKFTQNVKTVKVKGVKKVTSTIKKLKEKKKYFVRVRTYTKTKAATYYSKWSKAKTAKTK